MTAGDYRFEVGDRVVAMDRVDSMYMGGKTGTVLVVNENTNHHYLGIEFDNPFEDGHTCGGRCQKSYGRYARKTDLIQPFVDDDNDANYEESEPLSSFLSQYTYHKG